MDLIYTRKYNWIVKRTLQRIITSSSLSILQSVNVSNEKRDNSKTEGCKQTMKNIKYVKYLKI